MVIAFILAKKLTKRRVTPFGVVMRQVGHKPDKIQPQIIGGGDMKPKDTKRAIEQLILDIQYNEWYCVQGDSESELKDWEKILIVNGLKKLLSEAEDANAE